MFDKSPIAVIILTMVTFGIYGLIWIFKTAGEMQNRGAEVPSIILLFLPILNLLYLWKYCQAVEKVTNGDVSGTTAFVLWFVFAPAGIWVIQSGFNKIAGASA